MGQGTLLTTAQLNRLLTAQRALANTALHDLSSKGLGDGPQYVDLHWWQWRSVGTPDGGTVVAASDGGFWWRAFTGPVEATWFGVRGEGVTDDGPALQLWINAACSRVYGALLSLPPGIYLTGQELLVSSDHVTLDFRGILRPFGSYGGYLLRLDSAARASNTDANQEATATFGLSFWQKRIHVACLTVDGNWTSRGVWFSRLDHYDIRKVIVRRTLGTAVVYDRCREGDSSGVKVYHCDARARGEYVVQIVDQGPGDTNNTANFTNMEIVYNRGGALLIDSPYKTVPPYVAPDGTVLIEAPLFPARFLNFHNLHVEDFLPGVGFPFGSPSVQAYPDPTVDAIWIRDAQCVRFFGGALNSGQITTGSVVRLGDSSGSRAPVTGISFHGVNVFAFRGTGYAVKAENVQDFSFDTQPWLGETVKPVLWNGTARVHARPVGEGYTVPSGTPGVALLADSAAATGSPTLELHTGSRATLLQTQSVPGQPVALVVTPDSSAEAQFLLDSSGQLYTLGTSLMLGASGQGLAGVRYAPRSSAPVVTPGDAGLTVLADGAAWNPAGKAAGSRPYLVTWDGALWNAHW